MIDFFNHLVDENYSRLNPLCPVDRGSSSLLEQLVGSWCGKVNGNTSHTNENKQKNHDGHDNNPTVPPNCVSFKFVSYFNSLWSVAVGLSHFSWPPFIIACPSCTSGCTRVRGSPIAAKVGKIGEAIENVSCKNSTIKCGSTTICACSQAKNAWNYFCSRLSFAYIFTSTVGSSLFATSLVRSQKSRDFLFEGWRHLPHTFRPPRRSKNRSGLLKHMVVTVKDKWTIQW